MRWVVGVAALGLTLVFVAAVIPGNPVWRFFDQPPLVTQLEGETVGERGLKMVEGLPRDAIAAIMEPTFVSGREAEQRMRSHDRVIGLSVNGDHRTYSIAHLSGHEIVNDTVGDVPVAVTWCPLCFTAMVFGREVNGRELTFGVSGNLIMNSLVMYDHQTDTLWSQFLGEAVQGPLESERLALFPSQLTTWEAWVEQHPDTLLLDPRIGRRSTIDGYQVYYSTRDAGVLGETHVDDRLPTKELVVGIDYGERPKAYAFGDLRTHRVVSDRYEGAPIVVTFDPDSRASAVFSRDVNGQVLTFESEDRLVMRDTETGTRWSVLGGDALEGPLTGTTLERLPSFAAFWFAWSDFYPDTDLYRQAEGE